MFVLFAQLPHSKPVVGACLSPREQHLTPGQAGDEFGQK